MSRGRRLDPVAERHRRIMVQILGLALLAAIAMVLVVMALRTP